MLLILVGTRSGVDHRRQQLLLSLAVLGLIDRTQFQPGMATGTVPPLKVKNCEAGFLKLELLEVYIGSST